MSAGATVMSEEHPLAIAERFVAAPSGRHPAFWIGFAVAALLHVLVIVGIGRSSIRQMGEAGGLDNAISVEIVDAGELRSSAARSSPPPGSLAPPPQPLATPVPETPPPLPEETSVPETVPPPKSAPPPEAAVESQPETELADLPSLEESLAKAAPAEPANKAETPRTPPRKEAQPKPQAKLDLKIPDMPMGAQGRSSAMSRPPGITRSGQNDDFGRGVIRALRQTMPPPQGTFGRVTIKLVLSMNGNIADLRLLESAGIPTLDQSVMFAAQQASFPFPPPGATEPDRTFFITYIYN